MGSVQFLLGVVCLLQLAALPSLYWCLLLAPAAYLAACGGRLRPVAWFICGFLWALLQAGWAGGRAFDTALEGAVLSATGEIASLPEDAGEVVRFNFRVRELSDAAGRPHTPPGLVRLGWYRDAPPLVPGERWRLTVRLRRPRGFMNPGGLDYEGWLFRQGIRATGYVLERKDNRPVAGAGPWDLHRIRFHIRERLRGLFDGRAAALVPALAVGDRSAISSAQWQVLNRTGTTHLLAISGLHVGLVAAMAFFLVRRAWPLGGVGHRLLAAPHAAAVAAVAAGLLYAALAGFSVPTRRAVVMVCIWAAVAAAGRRSAFSRVVALTLLAVVAMDPLSVLEPGFWLSFLAITVIGWGMGCRSAGGLWWRWGRTQAVVAIGLAPVLVFWFQQVPVYSLPANALAVPWVGMLTVPLVFAGAAGLAVHAPAGEWLLRRAGDTLDLLWPALSLLSGAAYSVLVLPRPGPWAAAAAAVGVLLLLLPRGFSGRWVGLVWILPLLFPAADRPQQGAVRFTVLDVGQGLAAVAQTRRHTLLFDTGPRYGGDFTAGRAVVLPFLRQAGVHRVDLLVQSHGDSDHAGGLADVSAGIPVRRIIGSGAGDGLSIPFRRCRAGMRWHWDGVEFEILHPPPGTRWRGNNGSCVLRISGGERSILLTGDIEREAEFSLLERAAPGLSSNVMIAPHHGSLTSSSYALISSVEPDYVVFASGFGNRFGLPNQDIIARYRLYGATILNTARSGAIRFEISDADLSLHEYRPEHRRFWHSRP